MHLISNINSFILGKEKPLVVHLLFIVEGWRLTGTPDRRQCQYSLTTFYKDEYFCSLYSSALTAGFLCISRPFRFLNKEYKAHKLPLSREQNSCLSSRSILNAGGINLQESCYQVHEDGEIVHLHRGGKLKLHHKPQFCHFPASKYLTLQCCVLFNGVLCVTSCFFFKKKTEKNARDFMKILWPYWEPSAVCRCLPAELLP